ncbi:MAG: putative S-layer protein [Candidatus Nanoarchaeia archaeon]|nr:putative S-layer protein [Candidatus Nanoarchaeia archaeon]
MKSKTLSLFALSALALVLLVSSASALVLTTTPATIPDFTYGGQVQTITITGDEAFNVTMPTSSFFNVVNTTGILGVTTATFNITSIDSATLPVGPNTLTITAADAANASDTDTFAVTFVNSFCELGAVNATDLSLAKVKISNEGQGKDKEWLALDTIKVEVKFENNMDEDVLETLDNVIFKLGLIDSAGKDVAEDLKWISDGENEVDVGDIDAGDDYTHVFEFKINPSDVDSGSYKLVVKAYPDGDENSYCIDYSTALTSTYYENVVIKDETDKDKSVVVDVDALSQPIEVKCGEKVVLTADVWNIGNTDFSDKVKVTLFNTALGLNMENVIDGDIDAGDNAKVAFTFDVPRNAEEKTYSLGLRTYYDYDSDDDEYKRISDDTFNVQLKVAGSCVYATADTTDVTVELASGGKAGAPLVLTATVKNTGDKTVDYTFSLAGYSSWASLEEITPVNVTLAPGKSQEVSVTLNVDKDASGDKTFDFETYSNGQLVTRQPLSASIAGGFSLASITGGVISGSMTPLVIGLVTVILVVLIIIILVKVAKK